jgi:hypothetical protein
MFHNFGRYLLYLYKHNGSLFVVKYLKAAQLSIQRKLAGQPFSSLREIEPDLHLPRLSKCGLPAIIGTRDRAAIMAGSTQVIKLYLTLFGLYRVIKAPGKLKLNTITDGYTGRTDYLVNILDKFSQLSKKFIHMPRLSGIQIQFLQTSSPSSKISILGLSRDAYLLEKAGIGQYIERWLELSGSFNLLDLFKILKLKSDAGNGSRHITTDTGLTLNQVYEKEGWSFDKRSPNEISKLSVLIDKKYLKINDVYHLRDKAKFFVNPFLSNKGKTWFKPILQDGIGQLAFKEEAAGKIRVFAMVDCWTQSIMKPLHDALFQVLAKLPNDGTFDQNAAFERAQIKSHVAGCCYAYDLSSATDRLPILLQIAILEPLLGKEMAHLWADILVNRVYDVPVDQNGDYRYGITVPSVLYGVGQPMGALSSWAMLAITHHLIMQFCNSLLGNSGWTDQYEVLGDDIVIFDKNLAIKYLEVMEHLGVGINTSKSVVSTKSIPVVEFAKRTSFNLVDVSPISWKMFLNQDTFAGRLSIVSFMWKRSTEYLFSTLRSVVQVNLNDNRIKDDSTSFLALVTSLVASKKLELERVLAKLSEQHKIIKPFGKKFVANFSVDWAKKILLQHYRKIEFVDKSLISFNYSRDERYHLAAVRTQISKLLDKHSEAYMTSKIDELCGHWGSVIAKRSVYPIFFTSILTFRSMRFINLKHLSLQRLLKILEQLDSASSIFRITELKRNKQKITNDLQILKFLEKSNRKKNRADPSICPILFFTHGQMMFSGFQQRH